MKHLTAEDKKKFIEEQMAEFWKFCTFATEKDHNNAQEDYIPKAISKEVMDFSLEFLNRFSNLVEKL